MAESAKATLTIQGGPNSGQSVTLTGKALTFGRRPDNDLVVDEASVSRRHALVIETAGGYVVRDLNSTNGTFVNRERIADGERVLRHGDRIRIGGSQVVFIFRNEAPSTLRIDLNNVPAERESEVVRAPSPSPASKLRRSLSDKAVELLKLLDSRKGTPVSRQDIFRNVWPEMPEGERASQQMSQTIEELRAAIEDDPAKPNRLITIGEFGYMLL